MILEILKKIFAPQSKQHDKMRTLLFEGLEEKYKENLLNKKQEVKI